MGLMLLCGLLHRIFSRPFMFSLRSPKTQTREALLLYTGNPCLMWARSNRRRSSLDEYSEFTQLRHHQQGTRWYIGTFIIMIFPVPS